MVGTAATVFAGFALVALTTDERVVWNCDASHGFRLGNVLEVVGLALEVDDVLDRNLRLVLVDSVELRFPLEQALRLVNLAKLELFRRFLHNVVGRASSPSPQCAARAQ